jgi:hypothetical protein
MAGIDQDDARDLSRVFGSKNADVLAAYRLADEHVGWEHAGAL